MAGKHTQRAKAASNAGKQAAQEKECLTCGQDCDAKMPDDKAQQRVAATVFAEASANGPQEEFDATAASIYNRIGNSGFHRGNLKNTDDVLNSTYKGRDGKLYNEYNAVGNSKYNRALNGKGSKADCPAIKKSINAVDKMSKGVPSEYKGYTFSGAAAGAKNAASGTQIGGSLFGSKPFHY